MQIDYKKLIPTEISDEFAYHLGDFLYSLAIAFDDMHIGRVLRYEKLMRNDRFKSKTNSTKSNSGVLS
jgi:hypothetical protein